MHALKSSSCCLGLALALLTLYFGPLPTLGADSSLALELTTFPLILAFPDLPDPTLSHLHSSSRPGAKGESVLVANFTPGFHF